MINPFGAYLGMAMLGTVVLLFCWLSDKGEKKPKKKQSVIIQPDTHKPFKY